MPPGLRHRQAFRLEQAGYGRAVAAEIEQEGADVRRGPNQDDHEGVRVQDGDDCQAMAELEDGRAELAPTTCIAELRHVFESDWEQRGHTLGVNAVGNAGIDGQSIAPDHHHGVHTARSTERFDHVADGRHKGAQRRFLDYRSQAATVG